MVFEESSKKDKKIPSEEEVADEWVSDGWIERMTADQIIRLPIEVLSQLAPEQINKLLDIALEHLTPDQISELPKKVIENLTPEQLKAIPLKKVVLRLDELNEEELMELSDEDWERIERLSNKLKKIRKNSVSGRT